MPHPPDTHTTCLECPFNGAPGPERATARKLPGATLEEEQLVAVWNGDGSLRLSLVEIPFRLWKRHGMGGHMEVVGKGPPAWHIFPPRLGCPAVIRQEMEQASGQRGNLCPLAFHGGSGLHCIWSEYRDRTKQLRCATSSVFRVVPFACLPACLPACVAMPRHVNYVGRYIQLGRSNGTKDGRHDHWKQKNGRHMCHGVKCVQMRTWVCLAGCSCWHDH
jgi:hypothetical protein